jgi:hypothetical protein
MLGIFYLDISVELFFCGVIHNDTTAKGSDDSKVQLKHNTH